MCIYMSARADKLNIRTKSCRNAYAMSSLHYRQEPHQAWSETIVVYAGLMLMIINVVCPTDITKAETERRFKSVFGDDVALAASLCAVSPKTSGSLPLSQLAY